MKTQKKTQKKTQEIKILVPAKKSAKLANCMDCCRAGSPAPVGPVEDE